jgi:glycosyltransferase A (GT-A) superfamily protein (DUF2064 family)
MSLLARSAPLPGVLVMARALRVHAARPALEPVLGPERCAALERLLLGRAVRWGLELPPGRVIVAHDPADSEPALRTVVADEAELLAQRGDGVTARVTAACAHAFDSGSAPVLIIWPDLPRWRRELALGALGDLADGCAVSVGPVFDGGFYLLALPGSVSWLATLPECTWAGHEAMGLAIAAARDLRGEAGMLRAERALRRPDDVRAALADPLLDAELAAILRR